MAATIPSKRPDCQHILNKKELWALNKEELAINDELKNIITLKIRKKEFTIYSLLRREVNSVTWF
jgi:hypothetical protein